MLPVTTWAKRLLATCRRFRNSDFFSLSNSFESEGEATILDGLQNHPKTYKAKADEAICPVENHFNAKTTDDQSGIRKKKTIYNAINNTSFFFNENHVFIKERNVVRISRKKLRIGRLDSGSSSVKEARRE